MYVHICEKEAWQADGFILKGAQNFELACEISGLTRISGGGGSVSYIVIDVITITALAGS